MKVETTPVETVVIVLGFVLFVSILFIIYHHQREQISLTRNAEGRLELQE